MNAFSSQSDPFDATSSSDDHKLAPSTLGATPAVVLGHSLFFGLLGQLALPTLFFLNPTNHRARTPDPMGGILMWTALSLPLVLAILGAVTARWKPIHWLGHGVSIALTVVAIMALGMLDLIALFIWSWPGYC